MDDSLLGAHELLVVEVPSFVLTVSSHPGSPLANLCHIGATYRPIRYSPTSTGCKEEVHQEYDHAKGRAVKWEVDPRWGHTGSLELDMEAEIPGKEEPVFQQQAEIAKKNCPVSRALAGPQITLAATLVR